MPEGRIALERLERSGQFVFHGSPSVIEVFEPRQATQFDSTTGKNLPDGEPAVFAADQSLPAIFKGLINGVISPGLNLLSGWRSEEGKLHFYSVREGIEGARKEGVKAYVYVFNKSDFEPYRGMEYRSLQIVTPKMTIEVTGQDLPEEIEIIPPPEVID
jgi:hypothetical protein